MYNLNMDILSLESSFVERILLWILLLEKIRTEPFVYNATQRLNESGILGGVPEIALRIYSNNTLLTSFQSRVMWRVFLAHIATSTYDPVCMGSSDWLRVYPFEEHVLLHGAWCQQLRYLRPPPILRRSDERGEGVSSRSRAPLCDDAERRDRTSTRSRSRRQHSRSAAMAMACDCETQRGRAGVLWLWAFRSDSTAKVQHSWSWGVLSSGPASAERRINQRRVSCLVPPLNLRNYHIVYLDT